MAYRRLSNAGSSSTQTELGPFERHVRQADPFGVTCSGDSSINEQASPPRIRLVDALPRVPKQLGASRHGIVERVQACRSHNISFPMVTLCISVFLHSHTISFLCLLPSYSPSHSQGRVSLVGRSARGRHELLGGCPFCVALQLSAWFPRSTAQPLSTLEGGSAHRTSRYGRCHWTRAATTSNFLPRSGRGGNGWLGSEKALWWRC